MIYRLGDICSITKGAIGIMKAVPGTYPMVTLAEERKSHSDYQFDVREGAVIVPLVSSTGHGHASLKRVHYQEGKFALGNILCALVPKNPAQLLAKYLHIFLQDNKEDVLVPLMRGMANVSLPMGKIADIKLDVPSIERQREIIQIEAQLTQNYEQLIRLFNEQDTLTNQLQQAILQDAVQGKLTGNYRLTEAGPPGGSNPSDSTETGANLLTRIRAEKAALVAAKKLRKEKPLPPITEAEKPFDLPKSWVWCRFDDVAEIESNLVNPYQYPNLPHIAPDNIEKGTGRIIGYRTVAEDEVISVNHLFRPGQIIYSKVRPKLNKAVLVEFEGLCSADMYPIRARFSSKYLLHYMLSIPFLTEVDKYDNRVKMPKLNQNQLNQLPIPLPPLAEQQAIVEAVERALGKVAGLRAELAGQRETAGALQRALLHRAFSGGEVVEEVVSNNKKDVYY